MNCSANTPVQLSFFSESLNAIVCSANDRKRSAAAEGMEQLIRDRGYLKGQDYSYVNIKTKISLTCSKGHHFKIRPDSFKEGQGCRKCAGTCPQQAKENFEKALADRDYLKGEDYVYVNTITKISLICSKGHQYKTTPHIFVGGSECLKCIGKCPQQSRRNFEELVWVRGYSKGENYSYVNSRAKVPLMCHKGHCFNVRPDDFAGRGRGCAKCLQRCPIQAKQDFEQAMISRGYSKGEDYLYINTMAKVSLRCPSGHRVSMNPNSFKRGVGCPVCAKRAGYCPAQAKQDFEKSIAKRGYAKGVGYQYVGIKTKVSLVCGDDHSFCMTPQNVKRGHGCPACAKTGFNQCIPAILYYIVFYPQPTRAVYKIGITNRTVAERYSQCKTPYRILVEKQFESGLDCLNEETMLIRKHRKHRCKDAPVDGLRNRELFDIDVLGLDIEL
jgi:hypothetical protein